MRRRYWIGTFLAAVFAAFFASCTGGSSGNSDCSEVNPPAQTKTYGQSCFGFYYGSCPTLFHDCMSNACEDTITTSTICTSYCSTDADCPSGYYCRSNGSSQVCTPPATCSTYCDGTLCCQYYRDPSDPTNCLQGACY